MECSCGARRIDRQIGLEKSIAEYIATMVAVFDQVKRVLRRDGVCFVNIGDSYSGAGRGGQSEEKRSAAWQPTYRNNGLVPAGTKAKDLCLIPERLAIALQDAGWYIRSRIAWIKPAPMPESVTDRPTSAWEHIFMLTKSASYYYDVEAVREPNSPTGEPWGNHRNTQAKPAREVHNPNSMHAVGEDPARYWGCGRNLRNWWQIGPDPSSEAYCVACDLMYDHSPQGGACVRCKGKLTAHYAAFPRELVRKCILAGTPERGSCSRCGMPWVRVVKPSPEYTAILESARDGQDWYPRVTTNGLRDTGLKHGNKRGAGLKSDYRTLGWKPQCKCNAPTLPALCFDPFGGTNTTGIVAEELGRRWVITELSWDYCKYSQRRAAQPTLKAQKEVKPLRLQPSG